MEIKQANGTQVENGDGRETPDTLADIHQQWLNRGGHPAAEPPPVELNTKLVLRSGAVLKPYEAEEARELLQRLQAAAGVANAGFANGAPGAPPKDVTLTVESQPSPRTDAPELVAQVHCRNEAAAEKVAGVLNTMQEKLRRQRQAIGAVERA